MPSANRTAGRYPSSASARWMAAWEWRMSPGRGGWKTGSSRVPRTPLRVATSSSSVLFSPQATLHAAPRRAPAGASAARRLAATTLST